MFVSHSKEEYAVPATATLLIIAQRARIAKGVLQGRPRTQSASIWALVWSVKGESQAR
jgi:hypothetical protein